MHCEVQTKFVLVKKGQGLEFDCFSFAGCKLTAVKKTERLFDVEQDEGVVDSASNS